MRTNPISLSQASISPLSLWIRTGRWVPAQVTEPALEVKFNPNHDPKNGRFAFANGSGGGGARSGRDVHRHRAQDKPQPVRLKDGTMIPNPNSPTGVLMQPPGVSLEKNVADGASWLRATANAHMIINFRPGGTMDYQRTYGIDGKINGQHIDFGNYNYGAVAAAAGYTLDEAQAAAGIVNLHGNGNKSGMYFGNPRN